MTLPSLLYAYAIAALPEGEEPLAHLLHRVAGIDGAPVALVSDTADGALRTAVLVSAVDAASYVPDQVEARVGELHWLAPRAEAHDRIVTAAADAVPVIPLPIFSLFRDDAAVRAMLAERREELRRLFARLHGAREYTVRVYRDEARLNAALASLSARVQELERSAAGASPGQRYLLQRKLDEERRTELRRVSGEVAHATFARLGPIARAAVREPLPAAIAGAEARGAASTQPAILNASFLVDDERLDEFRRHLSDVIALREQAGFRVEFTGPWPAYHFARETSPPASAPAEPAPDGEARDG
jgi:hypothetical protein